MGEASVRKPSSDDQAAMKEFWHSYEQVRDAVSEDIRKSVENMPDFAPLLRAATPEQTMAQEKRGRELQRLAILEGQWDPYIQDLRDQGVTYARMGVGFGSWLVVFSAFRQSLRRLARTGERGWSERAADGMNAFLDLSIAVLGEAYLSTKEKIIHQQQQAIRELSTPVLQVRDRLLIIPVVGVVDTQRARQLTEALLRGIRDRRARAVVMDITGVPIVDSKVANHLVQACEAARLMGAKVILTGISSEIAQAMVAIGAELRGVRTVSDLQGGLEEAEQLLVSSNGMTNGHAATQQRVP